MESESSKSCPACGSWWRLPLLLGLLLAAIVLTRGRGIRENAPKSDAVAPTQADGAGSQGKVSLAVDFGDGRTPGFSDIAWHEGMTVADALSQASGMEVTQKGSGRSAFLTAIDGIANEGASGRNWTYAVNGQSADRSFAVYELRPGDRILWTFGPRP